MTRAVLGCLVHVCMFALAFSVGCGDRDDESMDESGSGILPTTTGDSTDSGGDKFDLGGDGDGDATSGDGTQCPCENVQDGIYVLNSNSPPSVWFFDPPDNTFTEVGTLGCDPGLGWTANSMAIDRAGYAWVNYYDQLSQSGKIFKASLWDLGNCVQQPYQQPQGEWWLLGMGYAVTDPITSCDELFVYKSDKYIDYPNFAPGGAALAEYVEGSGALKILGNTPYPVGELTGTGDGRLFTFATVAQNQAVLVELDKDTGAEKQKTDLPGFDITNAFAFAFWGGDVYFFTETSPASGVSKVTKLDYDNNEGGGMTTYNANTGIHIPGAGVSTCASYTPPG